VFCHSRFASPAAPDDETLLTPVTLPDLAVTTKMFVASQGEALAKAVERALGQRLAAQ
jgi:hypothetical protein